MTLRSVLDASTVPYPLRACDECGEAFEPRRGDQRFCPGRGCRQRWHRRVGAARPHACPLCKWPHDPTEGAADTRSGRRSGPVQAVTEG